MEDKESDAQRLRSQHGGEIGGPSRARHLTPERRSEIARIAEAARARKYARPPLRSLSPEELMRLLMTQPSRSFTRPELRKIVRGFGYHLDRSSHRYWHPGKAGWIALPLGKYGIIAGLVARELLRPLIDGL
jgi:hypothetical protein